VSDAQEQIATLLGRDPVASVSPNDPYAVAAGGSIAGSGRA
jgi:hypothetical protein